MSNLDAQTNCSFRSRLPESRLGQSHSDLESFARAVSNHEFVPPKTKEFTLVIVTASPRNILLGLKHRGFGKGMWNSFGGKFHHPEESPEECASRELEEETNILVAPLAMRNANVGLLRYTFEGDPVGMVMHLYRIHMPRKDCAAYSDIRACEEITPQWFDDWHDIPLDNMFADDSHWLVTLLSLSSTDRPLEINGRFHFRRDCQTTNTILHYWMDAKEKTKLPLEEQSRRQLNGPQPQQPQRIAASDASNTSFEHRLPESRLGQRHTDFESFYQGAAKHSYQPMKTQEYTLIVVTASPCHILLGHKNRGFGEGMYNSFGGKFHPNESAEDCASRELLEETNICISPITMRNSNVGILRFTSENDPLEMVIHLYRIHMPQKDCSSYSDIRACEEMTPKWFDDWREIPLDNMFADDSHWLTQLLSSEMPLEINGRFHFQRDCQASNTILHYYMDIKDKPNFTLEQRLFHAIHKSAVQSPNVKEFKECFAFQNIVRSAFPNKKGRRADWDIVIDVAGGHGALAALFLICTGATKAVVVDPATVGNGGVERAWKEEFFAGKELLYRTECLRTGLPAELKEALTVTIPERILVVACHACQHLSEETLEIASRYGVHAAVMPCCQKDVSSGSSWKAASNQLSIPVAHTMDLLLAGKMMASRKYNVRMKFMDSKITPQNRVIICQATNEDYNRNPNVDIAHAKLTKAYQRAHNKDKKKKLTVPSKIATATPAYYLGAGFVVGALVAITTMRRQ